MRLLDSIDITKYDLFAWMQTKKSPHIAPEQGEYWRRSLLKAFAGSKEIVADCVQLFRDDPSVGLVAAAEWRSTHMGNNQEQYERALDLFQIDERHRDLRIRFRNDVLDSLRDPSAAISKTEGRRVGKRQR